MSSSPPNLWDWLYRCLPMERDLAIAHCLRGMRRDDIKRRYYEVAYSNRVPSVVHLWICRMIGVYHRRFPDCELPDCYPVGHQFERIADIRTANFQRKESAMSQFPSPAPQAPRVPGSLPQMAAPYGQAPSPEDRIKQCEDIIASAQADIAERERRAELGKRIDYEYALAAATGRLLADIRNIELGHGTASQDAYLVQFRKELTPLAETYGFRIVLVGDRSVAVLTQ